MGMDKETARAIEQINSEIGDLRRRMENMVSRAGGEIANLTVTENIQVGQRSVTMLYVVSAFQALAGLRGFWPMTIFDSSGNAADLSGLGHDLTRNGSPQYRRLYSRAWLAVDDGTMDYMSHADHADFDITGAETYIRPESRGLTIGGWYNFDNLGSDVGLIGKWNTSGVNERSYLIDQLYSGGATVLAFRVSSDGTAAGRVNVVSSVTPGGSPWYFVCGRFVPSGDMDIFVGHADTLVLTQDTETGAAPASIHSGTASLIVGAIDEGTTDWLDGHVGMQFVCAQSLIDEVITSLFEHTAPLYQA